MREIILPGDLVATEPLRLENTYVSNGRTYAKILGLFEPDRKVILPLEGMWAPRIGDPVVGIVAGVRNTVYELDLGYYMKSILIGTKFDRQTYVAGDVLELEVKNVEDRKTIILTRPETLYGGTLITVKPTKVPRIMGKNNTMIDQIANAAKTNIVVGRNGTIWLKDGNVELATAAIRQIEKEAHTDGLTDRIRMMLEQNIKK